MAPVRPGPVQQSAGPQHSRSPSTDLKLSQRNPCFARSESGSWTQRRHDGLITSSSNLRTSCPKPGSDDVGICASLCQCLRQCEGCSCAAVRVGVGEVTGHSGDGHRIAHPITSLCHLGQCLNSLRSHLSYKSSGQGFAVLL